MNYSAGWDPVAEAGLSRSLDLAVLIGLQKLLVREIIWRELRGNILLIMDERGLWREISQSELGEVHKELTQTILELPNDMFYIPSELVMSEGFDLEKHLKRRVREEGLADRIVQEFEKRLKSKGLVIKYVPNRLIK